MMRSLWSAASGMIAQQTNLDNIANNLSNVNTTGFKKDTVEFKSLLYQTLQSKSTNNAGENKPIPAQVGLGTRVASITTVYTQGNLQASDGPAHMAIEGNGFFKVKNPDGDICYTRDGSFNLVPYDVNGEQKLLLCTTAGDPVLDEKGENITVPAGSKLIVDRTGNISYSYFEVTNAETGQGEEKIVALNAKIGIVQFNNPSGLFEAGGNLYKETVASGAPLEESTTNGLKTSLVHQGYLEMSNVQVADEMVNMIVAQRAYEMNSKAIQATDEMLQQANNLRR